MPLLFSTTVWLWPVSTATLSLPSEVTLVGTSALAVVPRACWPSTLLPQVQTVPSDFSAATCSRPPCMSMTPLRPLTGPGVRRVAVLPLPSWPKAFSPKVHGVPGGAAAFAGEL